ncbi:MAG: haloacid dehalogenase-like hydrolase [Eubacteriales bacterium]|nr:haloacid dehalogenase-like hydrolase [Eubacteriales bacterium]
MAKRLLSCAASDMAGMDRAALLQAIANSEGRVLACETIGTVQPMLGDVTNAEFAASQGADLLLLNLFDVRRPQINALPPCAPEDTVRVLKKLTGRPVGVNLEPVNRPSEVDGDPLWALSEGRRATVENAVRAADMGVDFLLLTGNPGIGVSNDAITDTLRAFRDAVGGRVVLCAGKMHAAGVPSEGGTHILTEADVDAFLDAGADVILLPAPGTVPGITTEYARGLIERAHARNKLAMTAVGTSQEGADTDTIRRIALACKMAGADIHHLGDAGYAGMALPENIFAYSVAIRGVRHTYHRMAQSVNR